MSRNTRVVLSRLCAALAIAAGFGASHGAAWLIAVGALLGGVAVWLRLPEIRARLARIREWEDARAVDDTAGLPGLISKRSRVLLSRIAVGVGIASGVAANRGIEALIPVATFSMVAAVWLVVPEIREHLARMAEPASPSPPSIDPESPADDAADEPGIHAARPVAKNRGVRIASTVVGGVAAVFLILWTTLWLPHDTHPVWLAFTLDRLLAVAFFGGIGLMALCVRRWGNKRLW